MLFDHVIRLTVNYHSRPWYIPGVAQAFQERFTDRRYLAVGRSGNDIRHCWRLPGQFASANGTRRLIARTPASPIRRMGTSIGWLAEVYPTGWTEVLGCYSVDVPADLTRSEASLPESYARRLRRRDSTALHRTGSANDEALTKIGQAVLGRSRRYWNLGFLRVPACSR